MRTHLYVLTILWISLATISYPFLYLIVGFANDNPTELVKILTPIILLFYFQLMIQSYIAVFRLKHVARLKQYLYAVLCILLAPVALYVGVTAALNFSSNEFALSMLVITFVLHVVGSIWMWIIITRSVNTNMSAPLVLQPTTPVAVQSEQDISAVNQNAYLTESVVIPPASPYPTDVEPVRTKEVKNNIVRMFLYAPVGIIALCVFLVIIISIVDVSVPGLDLLHNNVVETILTTLGALLPLSVVSCITAGIIYVVTKRK